MKKITVTVSLGLVGCKRTETFEVEDDTPDEEIEEMAQEIMFSLVEWSWSKT